MNLLTVYFVCVYVCVYVCVCMCVCAHAHFYKLINFFRLEKELLPLATTLCQDVFQDVRMCMCHQLEPLARALG